jgi:hypothetical protein
LEITNISKIDANALICQRVLIPCEAITSGYWITVRNIYKRVFLIKKLKENLFAIFFLKNLKFRVELQ